MDYSKGDKMTDIADDMSKAVGKFAIVFSILSAITVYILITNNDIVVKVVSGILSVIFIYKAVQSILTYIWGINIFRSVLDSMEDGGGLFNR